MLQKMNRRDAETQRMRRESLFKFQRLSLCTLCVLCVSVVNVFLFGCQPPKDTAAAPAGLPAVSASELREAYNQRADRIERFWAHSVVEVDWVDAEGDAHFEQGDGPLIVRKPDEFALAVGKLGNTILWLGRNAERYWLFELKPPKGQPATAYVGRIDELDGVGPRRLPLPIRPDQLIELLGVTPLPDGLTVTRPAEQPGLYQVLGPSVPGQARTYWWLNAELRPVRIGFIDPADGQVIAEAQLSEYRDLTMVGQPPGAWPYVPGRVEIRVPRSRASLRLFLSDVTNDPKKFRDAQFDFEALVKALKPQRIEVIEPG